MKNSQQNQNEFEDFRIRKSSKNNKKEPELEKRIHKESKSKNKFNGNFTNKKYDPDEWDEDDE